VYRTGLVLLCIDDSSLSRSVHGALGAGFLLCFFEVLLAHQTLHAVPQHWLQQPSLTGMYVGVVILVPVVVITKSKVVGQADSWTLLDTRAALQIH
jgi:hypothetical protein